MNQGPSTGVHFTISPTQLGYCLNQLNTTHMHI